MFKEAAWKKILKAMYRHPYITFGSIAIPIATFKAVTGTADAIHDTYDVASQHSQKKILENQLKVLERIASKPDLKTNERENTNFKNIHNTSYLIPKKLIKREVRYY